MQCRDLKKKRQGLRFCWVLNATRHFFPPLILTQAMQR